MRSGECDRRPASFWNGMIAAAGGAVIALTNCIVWSATTTGSLNTNLL